MAHRAAPLIVSENPFDDINTAESTTSTANPHPARTPAENHGETEVSGVRFKRCRSIFIKLCTAIKPARGRRPAFPLLAMFFIFTSLGLVTAAVDVSRLEGFIPLFISTTAILAFVFSLWASKHLTMLLCIASYIAVFAITTLDYVLDNGSHPEQQIMRLIMMVVCCALVPVVAFLSWASLNSGWSVMRGRNQQSRQRSAAGDAIELAHLPRRPSPAMLNPPQQLRTGLPLDHNRTGLESGQRSRFSDEGFQEVREFV